jgi:hypothetical protein
MLHQGKVDMLLHLVFPMRFGPRATRKHVVRLEETEMPKQGRSVERGVGCHSMAEKSLQIGATRWKRPETRLHHLEQSDPGI